MTQLFDEESGSVTSVTVIEAGPCPVVAVRTPDADGYEAVQLAYESIADRKISKAERGHLRDREALEPKLGDHEAEAPDNGGKRGQQ